MVSSKLIYPLLCQLDTNVIFRLEKLYNSRIIHCETRDCGHLILEESMNCVTKCVSEQCYKQAKYDVDPLEDGEVDESRAMLFAQCVRNEIIKETAHRRVRWIMNSVHSKQVSHWNNSGTIISLCKFILEDTAYQLTLIKNLMISVPIFCPL